MNRRIGISLMVIVVMMTTAAFAAKKTVLVVETDPPGADVHAVGYGLLGQTPLRREFSKSETKGSYKKSGSRQWPPSFMLTITKRGYHEINVPINLLVGKEYELKKNLEERLLQFDITSEPDGVAVFVHVLDSQAFRDEKDCDLRVAMVKNPANTTKVVKRFLGNTPIRYQEELDPKKSLRGCDLLVFQKAGYQDAEAYFKMKERRTHVVMQP